MTSPVVVGRASFASFVVEGIKSIIALAVDTVEIGVVRAIVLLVDRLTVPIYLPVPIHTDAILTIPYFILTTALGLLATTVYPDLRGLASA